MQAGEEAGEGKHEPEVRRNTKSGKSHYSL